MCITEFEIVLLLFIFPVVAKVVDAVVVAGLGANIVVADVAAC